MGTTRLLFKLNEMRMKQVMKQVHSGTDPIVLQNKFDLYG